MSPKIKPGKPVPAFDSEEVTSPQLKFVRAKNELCNCLIERDEEVEIALISMLAQEHLLLIGPPGTAKSMLVDSLASWVNAPKFDYLLTKFTDPMELFGPVDLNALKAGKTARVTGGFLPEAVMVFADEVFKASSAILNTLIKVLNERTFKYGTQTFKCPLRLCVGASNEWPNDSEGQQELGALFDRFLFRKTVKYISRNSGRRQLLSMAVSHTNVPRFPETITLQELDQAAKEASSLPLSNECKKALWSLLRDLDKAGVVYGDRRLVKSISAIRAAAYLDGAEEVAPEHLSVLQYVLWSDPTEQPQKCAEVVNKYGSPDGAKIISLHMQAEDVMENAASSSEAVVKLESIQKELEKLSKTPKRDRVLSIVKEYRKEKHFEVVGTELD